MIQNEFKIRRKLAASKNSANSSDDDEAEAIKNARVRGTPMDHTADWSLEDEK